MEEALISLLLDDVPVSASVSTRVYPGARPQNSSLPALTLRRISGLPVYTDDGESGLAQARVQIDCWGESFTSAKLVARKVISALSAYVGTVAGVRFQNVLLDTERDLQESGGNVVEYPFVTSLDFIVWYEN